MIKLVVFLVLMWVLVLWVAPKAILWASDAGNKTDKDFKKKLKKINK